MRQLSLLLPHFPCLSFCLIVFHNQISEHCSCRLSFAGVRVSVLCSPSGKTLKLTDFSQKKYSYEAALLPNSLDCRLISSVGSANEGPSIRRLFYLLTVLLLFSVSNTGVNVNPCVSWKKKSSFLLCFSHTHTLSITSFFLLQTVKQNIILFSYLASILPEQ